jgi:hypothetical protein
MSIFFVIAFDSHNCPVAVEQTRKVYKKRRRGVALGECVNVACLPGVSRAEVWRGKTRRKWVTGDHLLLRCEQTKNGFRATSGNDVRQGIRVALDRIVSVEKSAS